MRTERLLLVPTFLISIINLTTGILKQKPIMYYFSHVAVFVILVVFAFLIPKKNGYKLLYKMLFTFSCIGAWFGDYTDLNSVMILIFSLDISRKEIKKQMYMLIIFTFVKTSKYIFLDLKISELVVFFCGMSVFLILYYGYVYKRKSDNNTKVLINYDNNDLSRKMLDIVELKAQNYDWNEINDRLKERNVTDDTIRRDFAKGRKDAGFKENDFAFGVYCSQMGIINSISCDDDTNENKYDIN